MLFPALGSDINSEKEIGTKLDKNTTLRKHQWCFVECKQKATADEVKICWKLVLLTAVMNIA